MDERIVAVNKITISPITQLNQQLIKRFAKGHEICHLQGFKLVEISFYAGEEQVAEGGAALGLAVIGEEVGNGFPGGIAGGIWGADDG